MVTAHRSSLIAIVLAALGACPVGTSSHAPGSDTHAAAGAVRIRRHLESAEALLAAREVSTLTAAQRAARTRCVAELRAYRSRGVFPHNHQAPGGRTPVFIDEHGTRCAMAHLIECSGERALVQRIARKRNLARIRDLAGDAELVAWLDRNGLTLEEAARIQPQYDYGEPVDERRAGALTAAAFGAGFGLMGVGLNVSIGEDQGGRNLRGLVGIFGGIAGASLGVPALSHDGAVRALGAADIGVGIASIVLGFRQLNARDAVRPQDSAATLVPAAWLDSGGKRQLGLVLRF